MVETGKLRMPTAPRRRDRLSSIQLEWIVQQRGGATPAGVASFVRKWRARRDSNVLPLYSEGKSLPVRCRKTEEGWMFTAGTETFRMSAMGHGRILSSPQGAHSATPLPLDAKNPCRDASTVAAMPRSVCLTSYRFFGSSAVTRAKACSL